MHATALGKRFYHNRKVRYTVLLPVFVDLSRTNGSIFTREDYLPSTGVDLGELEVRASLSDEQQKEEVKRQVRVWIGRQPLISGERILIAGYETNRLDSSRPIQYNKLEFNDSKNLTQ